MVTELKSGLKVWTGPPDFECKETTYYPFKSNLSRRLSVSPRSRCQTMRFQVSDAMWNPVRPQTMFDSFIKKSQRLECNVPFWPSSRTHWRVEDVFKRMSLNVVKPVGDKLYKGLPVSSFLVNRLRTYKGSVVKGFEEIQSILQVGSNVRKSFNFDKRKIFV